MKEKVLSNATLNGGGESTDDAKKNSINLSKSGKDLVDEDDDEIDISFGHGGVAKIVGEIEKFNSLGKRTKGDVTNGVGHTTPKTNGKGGLTDVDLRDKTTPVKASNSSLSPFEKSVLREMPVDVEIGEEESGTTQLSVARKRREVRRNDTSETRDSDRDGGFSSGGEESPRKGGPGVKRTPTMEFKKQCSKIVRIRTKILQNLGKADKTTDEVFDEYEVNFTRQQTNANRLHKEVANYLRCARMLHGASKALFDTLSEVYEPEWAGNDLLYAQAQNSDMLWTDFVHKLQDQTLAPLTAYQIQFPELRKKIDKRGRKLVDYDSQRHQLEALQRNNRRDEYKLARCRDQLELARTTYDSLNKELYEELPGVYDQRVSRTAETLQTLYAAESTFMRESAKIAQELEAINDKLVKESSSGKYRTSRGTPITPRPISYPAAASSPAAASPQAQWFTDTPAESKDGEVETLEKESPSASPAMNGTAGASSSPDAAVGETGIQGTGDSSSNASSRSESPKAGAGKPLVKEGVGDDPDAAAAVTSTASPDATTGAKTKSGREEVGRPYEEIQFEEGTKVNGTGPQPIKIPADNNPKSDEVYDIPVGATTTGLAPGVLYQVRTTYKYDREDVDELTFDVGEVINVVEYEDPEEQEEGWLCGYKVSSNEKGLFPANFTRPI